MNRLLDKMILAGDSIYLNNGRLVIQRNDETEYSKEWIKANKHNIVRQILQLFEIECYLYKSHVAKKYPRYGGGINLRFESISTCEPYYTIYNIDLERARNTKSGKKGSPLPEGHFSVPDGSKFRRLWYRAGLDTPRSKTAYHDYMGNLDGIVFTAELSDKPGRLDKDTITPLTISYKDILDHYVLKNGFILMVNSRLSITDKGYPESHTNQHFRGNSTTSENYYEIRNQEGTITKKYQEQSLDEWMNDLGSVNE